MSCTARDVLNELGWREHASRMSAVHLVVTARAERDALKAKLEAAEAQAKEANTRFIELLGTHHLAAKLAEALDGTVKELLEVIHSAGKGKVHHDGDEFHERLTAAENALAQYREGR